MKKTVLFGFALFAMLITTTLSAQGTTTPRPDGTRQEGTRPGGGSTTGGGAAAGAGAGSQVGGSGVGSHDAGSKPGSQAGKSDDKMTYPKVFVANPPAPKATKSSRRLLAGNLFKGKNQKVDLTYDVVDSKGAEVPNDDAGITKEANGDIVIDPSKIDASKYKDMRKGWRLRVKGANGAVEYYPL